VYLTLKNAPICHEIKQGTITWCGMDDHYYVGSIRTCGSYRKENATFTENRPNIRLCKNCERMKLKILGARK